MTEEEEDFRDGSLLVHQVRKQLNTVLVATECFHDTTLASEAIYMYFNALQH